MDAAIDPSKIESVAMFGFNELNKELDKYELGPHVHYIIDKHPDHGLYDETLLEPRFVQHVGSTCTLIAKMIFDSDMLDYY